MTSPYRDPFGEEELQRIEAVESDEDFDRLAFAQRALDLVGPRRTRVVLCPGSRTLRVDTGRAWGKTSPARWAVFWVPLRASRRAIALAALELAVGHGTDGSSTPYALDALIAHAWSG